MLTLSHSRQEKKVSPAIDVVKRPHRRIARNMKRCRASVRNTMLTAGATFLLSAGKQVSNYFLRNIIFAKLYALLRKKI